jgi:hypothetical protein
MKSHDLAARCVAIAVAFATSHAVADGPAATANPLHLEARLAPGPAPALAAPLKLGQTVRYPVWTEHGLWPAAPQSRAGLEKAQPAGLPVFDPSTRAWYASAQGALVRVETDGRLVVMTDNVQGRDVDVRGALKRAVSREPNDTIVLHGWDGAPSRKVLMIGGGFFNPRFSPDGTRVLVKESRAGGGHMWLITLDGAATDLGQGYDPVWHPDGRNVVFARVTHDGLVVSAADLWVMDVQTRAERELAHTAGVAEVQPAISPDGRWVAFADGRTGEGYVAELAIAGAKR